MEKKKPQRIAKEKKVEELRKKLTSASSVILTDYRGLKVNEMGRLRKRLREVGLEYEVVKNTLLARAAEKVERGLLTHLVGPTAIAFGHEDPLKGIRALTDFAKEHKNLGIKTGMIEGSLIDASRIRELANFPSYEGLLSRVALVIKSPLQGVLNVLKGNMRNLVLTLKSIGAAKEGGS